MYKFNEYRTKVINESGIRNLKQLIKGFKETEIYFHKDLDGVATAIATKEYFDKYYGLKLKNCYTIQYGNEQFSVPKADEGETVLPILVDFASGNPQYMIQFDHHENQRGAENSVVLAKKAKSNAEIISDQLSYSQIFTSNDIDLIKTVDSADFIAKGLTPDDIMNVFYSKKSDLTASQNRFMMGLVVNKLLLVYKNKNITVKSLNGKYNHVNKNFLECLVMDSSASLISMYNNIMHYIKNADSIEYDKDIYEKIGGKFTKTHTGSKKFDKVTKLTPREELFLNLSNYIAGRAQEFDKNDNSKGGGKDMLRYDKDYGIVLQMNIGDVFKPGSYDRYTPFKNFPDSDFLVTMYTMGLIQGSGNPFKEKDAELNDIHMGKVALELLSKVKPKFNGLNVNLLQLKEENESLYKKTISKKTDATNSDYTPLGFTYSDLVNYFGKIIKLNGNTVDNNQLEVLKDLYNMRVEEMSSEDKELLSLYEVPVFDIILSSSGGHKGITNISGINYMKYVDENAGKNFNTPADPDTFVRYKTIKGTSATDKIIRLLGNGYVHILKSKIDMIKEGKEVTYDTGGLEFDGVDTNESHTNLIKLNNMLTENFDYFIVKNDIEEPISRDEFLRYSFSHSPADGFKMDIDGNRVIGRIENIATDSNGVIIDAPVNVEDINK